MGDIDEDAPPALAKLSSQVAALTTKPTVSSPGAAPVTAAVTIKYTGASQPKPLKSGFFDARKAQNKSQSSKEGIRATLPHIKANQGPAVPSNFLITPDEQDKQYAAMRQKLADDLMPTEDSIRQIASNQSLLAGFDDPEVMRAVQDVAQNPANIQKYVSNKKVQAFYEQMGSVLASRCDELGASQTKQTSSRSSPRQGSRAVGSATQSSNVEEVT